MAQNSYQLLTLTSNITLNWNASFGVPPIIADINDINANQNGWKIIMPNATLVAVGQSFIFNNISAYNFQFTAHDGATAIGAPIASGQIVEVYLTGTSTSNGTWRVIPFGSGASSITQFTAQSSDSSIVISNGTVTPPTGVINFALPASISNLLDIKAPDFLVVTDTNPLTFATREFIGGENIVINQGDGQDGNPIIDLNSVITSITSLKVGDLTLSGDVITNPTDDGNIQISTNGTGSVQINGVSIGASGSISGITNIQAYAVFTDTLSGETNEIVVQNQVNISSITGSNGTYTLHFASNMPTINYGVTITLGSTGGDLPFISNGYFIVRDLDSVTIIVTDASGELVLSAPHGVTVTIISS